MQGYKRSTANIRGQLHQRLRAIKLQAEHVMAGIIVPLCLNLAASPQHITAAFRSVFTASASQIKWSACQSSIGCWVAEVRQSAPAGILNYGPTDVYTLNLLTGAALCNGQAPSYLPESIVGHTVYQAVFPNVVHDVTPKVFGDQVTYHTVHAINGCYYSWHLDGGQLRVTETCNDETLELLPCASLLPLTLTMCCL